MTDLLPCPFCGGKSNRHTLPGDEFGNEGGDVIECAQCFASSRVEFGRKENIVAAWNTRPSVTVDVEALAAIFWREQAVDVGAPLSVSAGRTPEEFAEQSPETRAPFLKYAKAAIRALTGEPS